MTPKIDVHADGKSAIFFAPDTIERASVLYQVEGRKVHIRTGGIRLIWSSHNRGIIEREWPGIEVNIPKPRVIPRKATTSSYVSKTPDLPHQAEALSRIRALDKPVFALFMEPGTAKTKVAADYAGELHNEDRIQRLLVIAPKGVHRQWINQQLPQHLGTDWYGAAWPDVLPNRLASALQIFSIGYDGAKTKKGTEAINNFINTSDRFMLVLDESHYAKNPKTGRWKTVEKIANHDMCIFKMLLTGTPIAKNLVDEWAQLWLLDPDIIGTRYLTTFKQEYCILGGWDGKQVVKHRNLDKFKALTAPYIFRIKRSDLGMVDDEYREWYVTLTPKQRSYIREAKEEVLLQIDSGEIISTSQIGSVLAKIQQISNGWVRDGEGNDIDIMPAKDNPRLMALQEWIGESDLEEYPIAIWCRFHHDIEQIRNLNPDAYPYYGPVSDKARETNKEAWLKKGGIFLGTPGSGGVGLNLQGRCARVAYYSLSENYVDRVQSEARFSRLGKLGPIEFTDFIARGSRDYSIQRNLRNKKSLADLTLDDIRKELKDD